MRNILVVAGIISMMIGGILLAFGNGAGLILLMLGCLSAIVNK